MPAKSFVKLNICTNMHTLLSLNNNQKELDGKIMLVMSIKFCWIHFMTWNGGRVSEYYYSLAGI